MKRVLFFFLLVPLLYSQTTTEVEITAEPSHHLALENQYVRVFQVEVAPHAATLMHRHRHDYVYVTLGDAHLSNEVEGKPPTEVKLADGDTRFTPGNFAHIAKNLSDQPFRNVTIELMQDHKSPQRPTPAPEAAVEATFPGGRSKNFYVKSGNGVKVSEVTLEPGASMPSRAFGGLQLLVAINDLDLRSDIRSTSPVPVKLKSGDVKWLAGGYAPMLTNVGKSPARFATLEF
jgi:quercetin dioxygenase-like cupin family protein